jgi:hypothetical protein
MWLLISENQSPALTRGILVPPRKPILNWRCSQAGLSNQVVISTRFPSGSDSVAS